MRHKHLQFGHGFRVVLGDQHSQAAQMTLGPARQRVAPTTGIRARTNDSTSFQAYRQCGSDPPDRTAL